ncbi:hypothetical protein GCM10009863_39970 [Streptomyces axinellae]|uniref:Uncharacterized protein n=1 Tax=Streptomyces axinellae TaxID=552788 RepID=A0ABN3QBL1_9ACTN
MVAEWHPPLPAAPLVGPADVRLGSRGWDCVVFLQDEMVLVVRRESTGRGTSLSADGSCPTEDLRGVPEPPIAIGSSPDPLVALWGCPSDQILTPESI